MSKIITAALAADFLVLADGSASAQFANANLKGSIQAHGFDLNDFGDTGELAALGLLTFTVMASSKVPSGFERINSLVLQVGLRHQGALSAPD
jgi:hypothetical protein